MEASARAELRSRRELALSRAQRRYRGNARALRVRWKNPAEFGVLRAQMVPVTEGCDAARAEAPVRSKGAAWRTQKALAAANVSRCGCTTSGDGDRGALRVQIARSHEFADDARRKTAPSSRTGGRAEWACRAGPSGLDVSRPAFRGRR